MESDEKGSTHPASPDNKPGDEGAAEKVVTGNQKIGSAKKAHPRKDKNQLHATRHGILARYPLESLLDSGENLRALRGLEKSLRDQFQPRGAFEQILFDRAWSSLLHCLLIARAEKRIFADENQPTGFDERVRRTRALIQATGNTKVVERPENFLATLSVVQRYDGYYWSQFNLALKMLLESRNGELPRVSEAST